MWEQAESGRVTHPFEPVVLVATLAMIPVLIIQRDATSATWQNFAEVANWVIWAIFAAELAFMLVVAPRKKAALRAHWLDTAIVVVSVPLYGRLLSSMRLVRLVRLMRLARAGSDHRPRAYRPNDASPQPTSSASPPSAPSS